MAAVEEARVPELDPRWSAALARVTGTARRELTDVVDLHPGRLVTPVDAESLPRLTLLRTADLLSLQLRFVGVRVDTGHPGGPVLVRADAARDGRIVVVLPPQHLLEELFLDAAATDGPLADPAAAGAPAPTYPVRAMLSRESRIVLAVTDQVVPWTQAGLLEAVSSLPLVVVPHAEAAGLLLDLDLGPRWLEVVQAAVRDAAELRPAVTRVGARGRGELAPLADGGHATTLRRARLGARVTARFGGSAAVAAVGGSIAEEVARGRVAATGRPRLSRPPAPRAPGPTETALELPWRLLLSPHARGAFAHSPTPVEHEGRTELWHTRLGVRGSDSGVDESDVDGRTVRAVWTRDLDQLGWTAGEPIALPGHDERNLLAPDEPLTSLTARDRVQIVHVSSNHHVPGARPGWQPPAAAVDVLALTAPGGWLAARLQTPGSPPPGLSLLEWTHRTTMGRDQYVKVVVEGRLLPFGHRAALVRITERRVRGDARATLYQRVFVVVLEPDRVLGTTGNPALDHPVPLRWVRLLTGSTPPLAQPVQLPGVPSAQGAVFVPAVATSDTGAAAGPTGTEPFAFPFLATDADGHEVEFSGPMVFVEKTALEDARASALAAANAATPAYGLHGQRLAYAPPADPDDTTLPTTSLRFQARDRASTSGLPDVAPVLVVAHAVVPAMSAFTGQAEPVPLAYAPAYVQHGFATSSGGGPGRNEADLFLQVADASGALTAPPRPLAFSRQAGRSGGFVSPEMAVSALARRIGPVGGDLTRLATDAARFDPRTAFPLAGAKLFGVLPLSELLPTTGPLPTFVTRAVDAVVGLGDAVGRARTFVTTRRAALVERGVAAAADDLVAEAGRFTAAVAAVADPPHEAAPVESALVGLATAARTLLAAVGDEGTPLRLPRPERESAAAVLSRLEGLAADGAAVAEQIVRLARGQALPESVDARMEWSTALEPWSPAGLGGTPVFDPGGDRLLRLVSEVTAPLGGGEPTALVSCSLPPFVLTLLGSTPFLAVDVVVMDFSVRPGRKPDVDVRLAEDGGIAFLGPLAFVEALKDAIPLDGFSDPPYLELEPSGLRAGFDLALPDLAVGVFALTNIHLGAELTVPFIGESLELRFSFASREDPFRLQVAFFAGGGFFAITVGPAGVRVVEAAFEFGAQLAMSFVVASGSVSVMAGIYFRLEKQGDLESVQLTGYFRARGEVDVLGLISACIELYLELSYLAVGGRSKAVGRASISVEVSVCFLSFSVTISCEKKLAGSQGDPTFLDMMGPYVDALGAPHDPWAEYCAAFAPEAV